MKKIGICQSVYAALTVFFAVAMSVVSGVNAADNLVQSAGSDSIPLAITIDAENLIELYQSVPNLKIIDARHGEDRSQGYIETSHNLPLAQTSCKSLRKLTRNKDQALVFYCNGNTTDDSMDAIKIASSCGYRRLFWLQGGFVEWEDKDYPYVIE